MEFRNLVIGQYFWRPNDYRLWVKIPLTHDQYGLVNARNTNNINDYIFVEDTAIIEAA